LDILDTDTLVGAGNPNPNLSPIGIPQVARERVLFIGTQFSNLYTAVDTPYLTHLCRALGVGFRLQGLGFRPQALGILDMLVQGS
jgi:hypothetical protein